MKWRGGGNAPTCFPDGEPRGSRPVDRAASEIPIEGEALVWIELLRHLDPKGLENPGFLGEISLPIRRIELLGAQFMPHVSVPASKRWPTLRVVDTDPEKRDCGEHQQDQTPPCPPDDPGAHFDLVGALTSATIPAG